MKNSRTPLALLSLMLALTCLGFARQAKSGPAKAVTGHYEGTAKNKADSVITLSIDLTEKDGTVTGIIHSDHGDFTITGGSHKGDAVNLEFETGGPTGTIAMNMDADKMTGTWTAGDDGGSLEVKRAAAQEAPKGK